MLQEINRRPIALRTSWWSKSLAFSLIKAGLTPNQVSILSLYFACVGSLMLSIADYAPGNVKIISFVGTAVCIQLRLLCNMLDGLMAVEGGKQSKIGVLFNDIPDRFADCLLLITAGYICGGGEIGITLGWTAGLLALLSAYIRVLGGAQGLAQDFCGPLAKQQRMAMLTIASLLAAWEVAFKLPVRIILISLVLIVTGTFVTCIRRIWRLAKALENKT